MLGQQVSVEDPSAMADRQRARATLEAILNRLPDEQRIVFALFEFDEMTIALLEEAKARFAQGSLLEEREVLSIETLACSGRANEAPKRAEAFLRDYPTSLHAGALHLFVH